MTNLALALPTRHKVRGLQKKVLLRKAAEPLLPREIVHGRKRGFSIPAAAWLRGELEPFARDDALAAALAPPGLLRRRRSRRGCSTSTSRGAEDRRASSGGCSRSRSGTSATSSSRRRACAPSGWRRVARMKVWIDMTASAHVLVFRPLIAILRGAGRRGRDHGARLRADAAAARAARARGDGDRPARRPLAARQGARS